MGITRLDRDDSGIGLIEIVVSIFLLGLLAISALPLIINGMTTSQRTATLSTASQLVSSELERVRALGAPLACGTVTALAGSAPVVTDTRGVQYQPTVSVGACPGSYPGTIAVSVRVTDASNGDELARAATSVLVEQP
ncbi:hypothetical protein [Ruicaihuangia caeni]|uniref:Type II secretion system protein n=1 Tax=Ruicaihuangia caeni TaxID=3042517 RepID=A0AAW6T526_9MICO|nr:hypothetical protein [Klugiella sp. YN-L-19]MDI2098549.1 hypothetical protein [Klugiella sp. YN-L-19]